MDNTLKFPFYIKFALLTIGTFGLLYGIYIGQNIILPLVYATIIAILLNPLVNILVKHRLNKITAITLTVISTVLVTIGLAYLVSMQLSLFSESYPVLKEKFLETLDEGIRWISLHFNVKTSSINKWISETQNDAIKNMGGTIGQTLSVISGIIIVVVLLPVYVFMLLFYKQFLLEFIRKLFHATDHEAVFEVLINSKKIIQSYLLGLLLEAAIVAVLNSAGLLLLGIQYAIILGIIGALLNVIPYIGGVIAVALPMIIAYVTKGSSAAMFVLGLYLLIQFIDNNIIIPRIVASKVKINALVAIIVVLLGGALCGIPGMFLSIPVTAILKVIFDNIESLKPWGYLLGNIVPTDAKLNLKFLNRPRSKKTSPQTSS